MVSIILPTYNREKTIAASIESVLRQTYTNFELIIIDDGSKDNSRNIINQYISKDSRVKYIYQDNAGNPSALNRGIVEAKGEFIAIEDSDDLWADNKLEKQLKALSINNGDFSYCQFSYDHGRTCFPDDNLSDKKRLRA